MAIIASGNISGSATTTGSFGELHVADRIGVNQTNPAALIHVQAPTTDDDAGITLSSAHPYHWSLGLDAGASHYLKLTNANTPGGGTDYFSMGGGSITTPQNFTVQGNFYVANRIIHEGENDVSIEFTSNQIDFQANDNSMLYTPMHLSGSSPVGTHFTGSFGLVNIAESISGSAASTGSFGHGYFAGNSIISGSTTSYGQLTVENGAPQVVIKSNNTSDGDATLSLISDNGATNEDYWKIYNEGSDNDLSFKNGNYDPVITIAHTTGHLTTTGSIISNRVDGVISGSATSTGSFGSVVAAGTGINTFAGKVGIGVTNPGDYNSVGNTLVVGNTGGNAGITVASSNSSYGTLYFADNTSGTDEYDGAVEYHHGTRTMKFWAAANVTPPNITLESDGDVTLGANISGSATSTGSFGQINVDGKIVGATFRKAESGEPGGTFYAANINGILGVDSTIYINGNTVWQRVGDDIRQSYDTHYLVGKHIKVGEKVATHDGDTDTYFSFPANDTARITVGGVHTDVTTTHAISGSATSTGSFASLVVSDAVQGNLTVEGDVIAKQYIVSSSVTHLTASAMSGSTVFGDTSSDTHQFTGSLLITGSLTVDSGSVNLNNAVNLSGSATSTASFGMLASSGSVGVGTDSPVNRLTVYGHGTSNATAPVINLNSGTGTHHWSGLRFSKAGTDKWGIVSDYAANDTKNLVVWEYESSAARMYFETGGNVGIGNTDPAHKLDVTGTGRFTGTLTTAAITTTGITSTGNISGSATTTGSFGSLAVRDSVGIGDPNPYGILEINSTVTAEPWITFTGDQGNRLYFNQELIAAKRWGFRSGDSGEDILVMDSDNDRVGIMTDNPGVALEVVGSVSASADSTGSFGNLSGFITPDYANSRLGIGTSSPGQTFHAVGGGLFTGTLYVGTTLQSYNGDLYLKSNNGETEIFLDNDDVIALKTNNTERFRINNNGQLGINDNNPQDTLHIDHATGTGGNTVGIYANGVANKGNLYAEGNISGSATSTGSFGRVQATNYSGDGSSLTGIPTAASVSGAFTAGTGLDLSSGEFSVDVSDFLNNGVDNRVVTATGTDAMNSEANLTFDGSTLDVAGAITATGNISSSYNSTASFSELIIRGNNAATNLTVTGLVNGHGHADSNNYFTFASGTGLRFYDSNGEIKRDGNIMTFKAKQGYRLNAVDANYGMSVGTNANTTHGFHLALTGSAGTALFANEAGGNPWEINPDGNNQLSGSATSTGSFGSARIANNIAFGASSTTTIGNGSDTNLSFYIAGNERFKLYNHGGNIYFASNNASGPNIYSAASSTTQATYLISGRTNTGWGGGTDKISGIVAGTEVLQIAANSISGSATATGSFGAALISGHVGIGTTSPTQMVEIAGDVRIGSARSLFFKRHGDNYAWRVRNESAADGSTYGFNGSNDLIFEVVGASHTNEDPSDSSHTLYASSANTLVLQESGQVGIKVADPQYTLDVGGTFNTSGNINIKSNLIVTSDANKVGIGTTAPAEKLTVLGSISSSGDYHTDGEVKFYDNAVFGGRIRYIDSTNRLSIQANEISGDAVEIFGNDYTYIGTADDTDLLTLEGNNKISGSAISTGSFGSLVVADAVQGSLTVEGDIIANRYIVSSSVTHLTQSLSSGSTIFGDTVDDTHQFTGSLSVSKGGIVGTVSASSSTTGATSIDMSQSTNFEYTLTGDVTFTPTNLVPGQSGVITLIQDGTGGRTVSLNSLFKTPRGDSITFETGADTVSLLSYYIASTSIVAVNYMGDFS